MYIINYLILVVKLDNHWKDILLENQIQNFLKFNINIKYLVYLKLNIILILCHIIFQIKKYIKNIYLVNFNHICQWINILKLIKKLYLYKLLLDLCNILLKDYYF